MIKNIIINLTSVQISQQRYMSIHGYLYDCSPFAMEVENQRTFRFNKYIGLFSWIKDMMEHTLMFGIKSEREV